MSDLLWLFVAVLVFYLGWFCGEWHEERVRNAEWWRARRNRR